MAKQTAQNVIESLRQKKNALVDPMTAYQRQQAELDAELQRAQAAAKQAAEQERVQRLAALRADEKNLAVELWRDVLALDEKFSALDRNSAEIVLAGGISNRYYLGEIVNIIRGAKTIVKIYAPELIGLPPLPTAAEKARQERRADAMRKVKQFTQKLEQIAAGLAPQFEASQEREYQAQKKAAEQELAALQRT